MSTHVETLVTVLQERRFAEITLDQWGTVILDIIVEDLAENLVPVWTVRVPRVHFTRIFGLWTRDSGPIVAAAVFFKDNLPTSARRALSEALTQFVRDAYETLKKIGYDEDHGLYNQTKTLVDHGLTISTLLDGAVRADALEEMALDEKFHNRCAAVGNLLGQNFRNSASPEFWIKIEERVPTAPNLAPYVMDHYLEVDRPFNALYVLKHVVAEPEGANIIRVVEQALNDGKVSRSWEQHIKRIFGQLPPWVLDLMREEVKLDPVFQEVIDLLEPTAV